MLASMAMNLLAVAVAPPCALYVRDDQAMATTGVSQQSHPTGGGQPARRSVALQQRMKSSPEHDHASPTRQLGGLAPVHPHASLRCVRLAGQCKGVPRPWRSRCAVCCSRVRAHAQGRGACGSGQGPEERIVARHRALARHRRTRERRLASTAAFAGIRHPQAARPDGRHRCAGVCLCVRVCATWWEARSDVSRGWTHAGRGPKRRPQGRAQFRARRTDGGVRRAGDGGGRKRSITTTAPFAHRARARRSGGGQCQRRILGLQCPPCAPHAGASARQQRRHVTRRHDGRGRQGACGCGGAPRTLFTTGGGGGTDTRGVGSGVGRCAC